MSAASCRLRAENLKTWETVRGHPFGDALGGGGIGARAMRRYLIQEERLLDGLIRLLGTAVATAPTLGDRIGACRILGAVVDDERALRHHALLSLGIDARAYAEAEDTPATAAFLALMARVREGGSYAEMMAVLVADAWLFRDWALAVVSTHPEPPDFAAWITLYTGSGFDDMVGYLRDQLDTACLELSEAEVDDVSAAFAETVGLVEAVFATALADGA